MVNRTPLVVGVGLLALLAATACEKTELPVPTADVVASFFDITARSSVTLSGNVAELVVYQPAEQLRRGGSLWAKVGPYIYLFSDGTRRLFEEQPGLGGLRVVTKVSGGGEVARATLPASELNELTWKRALNISGLARRDGTKRPSRLEDLIRWGEEHTEFEYSSRYVRSR